ncbi:MAG: XrtA/PEP-CTERM system amidotransferase, partial [Halofilum sp. (in: g-proteobacteria)]
CGIAGVLQRGQDAAVDHRLIDAMNAALAHRGPDGEGVLVEPGIALGHRRLAIIDRGGGDQPLFNEDRSVAVVFNGEIYNFRELAAELAQAGHSFATHSDTEVIVHAWEQWGEDCVERLQGMFAFALWDRKAERLFLARDRLGIKPLHYALVPGGPLLFGSELKALVCHPDLPREIEPRAVEDYFAFGYIPDPRTILKHAFKLPPGHTLTVERDDPRLEPKPYWDVNFRPAETDETPAVDALVAQLDDTVRSHLVSEVPLGAFLSGGVDSSAVVAAMSRVSDTPVNTCSIGFEQAEYDESPHSARVAEHFGTHHHTHRVDINDFDLIAHLGTVYDEPFADSSAIPTYRLCEIARKQVTVALSGDGGDELFAGYDWYRGHLRKENLRRRIPTPLRGLGRRALALWPRRRSGGRSERLRTRIDKLLGDTVSSFAYSATMTTGAQRDQLFSDGFRRALGGYRAEQIIHEHAARAGTDDPLALAQYIDTKLYLAGDILTKVDRASMAHSLEVRVPLLDHRFVEWAATLPTRLKINGSSGKYVLKKAAERSVPPSVLYRHKKGFSIPLAEWLQSPLRERLDRLSAPDGILAETGYFRTEAIAELARAHVAGHADHSNLLWALLMFEQSLIELYKRPSVDMTPETLRCAAT